MQHLPQEIEELPQPGAHKNYNHGPKIVRYRCTICEKLLTRPDVLRRHSRSIHGIEEKKFEMVTTKRRPQIPLAVEPPKSWTPPPEARIRACLAPQNNDEPLRKWRAERTLRAVWITWGYTGQIPRQDEPNDYLKNHAILPPNNPRRITTNELMKDLFISLSSSGSTICQDEHLCEATPPSTPTMGSVYGTFK